MPQYRVACSYADYSSCDVIVDALTVDGACALACERAGDAESWSFPFYSGDTFVERIEELIPGDPSMVGVPVPVPPEWREEGTIATTHRPVVTVLVRGGVAEVAGVTGPCRVVIVDADGDVKVTEDCIFGIDAGPDGRLLRWTPESWDADLAAVIG